MRLDEDSMLSCRFSASTADRCDKSFCKFRRSVRISYPAYTKDTISTLTVNGITSLSVVRTCILRGERNLLSFWPAKFKFARGWTRTILYLLRNAAAGLMHAAFRGLSRNRAAGSGFSPANANRLSQNEPHVAPAFAVQISS